MIAVVGLLALGRFVPDLLERIAGARHAAGALRLIIATVTALVRAPPRFPKSFVVALMIVVVYAVWLLSTAPSAKIAAIVAVVIALQLGLRDLVFFFWNDEIDAKAAKTAEQDTSATDPGLLPSIVVSAARFVIVLSGLGACAVALDTPVAELASSESPMLRFGVRVLGVATLALLTSVVWITVKSAIDHRLRQIGPSVPHGEPGPGARLLTLLPLLAGAGVIGLALGFGAQALVRDVIAGICFLAEDAFRIGEYIESGTTTKGVVERITLRTVALRHHNGPSHFVPYGSLGTVRNNSRDWVIEKFNLPLPIGADSEKIRKMIKQIGQDMLADPEVGPLMLEPLKGKLYRIDPGVTIFRCKFRTGPGKQFDVRAQALKRVEGDGNRVRGRHADRRAARAARVDSFRKRSAARASASSGSGC